MAFVPRAEICAIAGCWHVQFFPSDDRRFLLTHESFSSREEAEAFLTQCLASALLVRGRWFHCDGEAVHRLGTGVFNTWAILRSQQVSARPVGLLEGLRGPPAPAERDKPASSEPDISIFRQFGAKGGNAAAEATRLVRQFSVTLAQERAPPEGWSSAPRACEAIFQEVNELALRHGRRYTPRKIEEWLRSAGIKRGA